MKRKNNTWNFSDWLLLFGGIWLISKFFKTAQKAGIGSLPEAYRKLKPYISPKGIRVFDNELKKIPQDEAGEIIRLIMTVRLKPELSTPLCKKIKGYAYIDTEFIQGKWRILAKQLQNGDFIMASFFKKQSNETPKKELERANKRIQTLFQK